VPNLTLLPFLRWISSDANEDEFWMQKFFESLQSAVRKNLAFQEAAYFRHKNGSIYRPVVVSYAKDASGTKYKLRVVFASAFGSPLTNSPGLEQRLSIGARLAVRTRLEVLDVFLGQMSRIHQDSVLSTRPEDEIARNCPVGGRVVEALDNIWQEALSHGLRPGGPAPRLFDDASTQRSYEDLRNRGIRAWNQLKKIAPAEDASRTGEYPKTEQLLAQLNEFNVAYLAVVLPRLQQLLLSAPTATVEPMRRAG
jgi:hypothetical protein